MKKDGKIQQRTKPFKKLRSSTETHTLPHVKLDRQWKFSV